MWKLGIGFVILIAGGIFAYTYLGLFQSEPQAGVVNDNNEVTPTVPNEDKTAAVAYSIEVIAQDLYVPWSLVLTSADRLIVSERNGNLRIIDKGVLQKEPLATFAVSQGGEEGLMGLALDPDYTDNKKMYACLASGSRNALVDKVISFIDNGNAISDEKILIDGIPAATNHAGCRLLFMPDKTLLITTGDSTKREIAQDLKSLGGKILRINRDGNIPADNPFPNSPVWSYGHRNPQGLAWDGEHEILWETEHGPSVFDGPAGGDEINIIEKAKNYGWPLIHHKQKKEGLISPLLEFTPAVAPSGMLFYTSKLFPQFTNQLFFAALKGEGLFKLSIDPKDPKRITAFTKMTDIAVGRIRDVVQAPDGSIYFATSNRDGRGKLRANDDKIYRLSPK